MSTNKQGVVPSFTGGLNKGYYPGQAGQKRETLSGITIKALSSNPSAIKT
jgi:hypothetical protein